MKFQRIEDLRIDHDKTQQQIADLLGCQREVYRRYEQGTRSIPIDMLIVLSDYYEVSIDYLVGKTDKKERYPK
ncbi:MAG: helix-turn-helix transcriptional regulator [Lachnospiraceae bacterium]|nr:helix-turn-helix transcriptional regulator [Lachnospiraceae bacterium]